MKLSTALAQIHFSKTFFCGAKIRKNIGGPRLNVRVLGTRIRSTRTGIWLTPSPRCLHASRTESWSVTRTPNLLIFQGIRGWWGERERRGGGYAVLRLLTLLANYENICAAHLAIGCGCCRDESPIHPDPRLLAKERGKEGDACFGAIQKFVVRDSRISGRSMV